MMQTTCSPMAITGSQRAAKPYPGAGGEGSASSWRNQMNGPACSSWTCPHPAIKTVRILITIDNSMPGGHARSEIRQPWRLPADQMLAPLAKAFAMPSPPCRPRLSHCMRWLGPACGAIKFDRLRKPAPPPLATADPNTRRTSLLCSRRTRIDLKQGSRLMTLGALMCWDSGGLLHDGVVQ